MIINIVKYEEMIEVDPAILEKMKQTLKEEPTNSNKTYNIHEDCWE